MTTKTVEVGNVKHVTTSNPIKLDELRVGERQKKNTKTAQIRQILETLSYYPSIKTENSMKGGLVSIDKFDAPAQIFPSTENRVAFVLVPDTYTEDQVNKLLVDANTKGAVVYKTLSNKPILDEDQKAAINLGLTTVDIIANKQIARFPKGTIDRITKEDVSDQLVIDKKTGKVQYRRTDFWPTFREDVDLRTSDETDQYLTPEIEAELKGASVMLGQKI